MARLSTFLHSLAVGEISREAISRVDLAKTKLAAEAQVNLLPKTIGSAFFRPGTEYLGSTQDDSEARPIPFIFSASDAANVELTDSLMRVWVDDALIERANVTSTVTNGDFSSSSGWTTVVTGAATATIVGGLLTLKCPAFGGSALCKRQVSTSSAGTEHALRIIVPRGPVTFRCGSTEGGDEYISETELLTGEHSLAFTPTGSYWVQFFSQAEVDRIVDSIQIEAAGIMTLPTPWETDDLTAVRYSQSGDVLFLACDGRQQRRIERRATRSWSIVLYQANDGPFTVERTAQVRLRPTLTYGNTTLTSDIAFFRPEHVGTLFRLFHEGQRGTWRLARDDTYSDAWRVTGINNDTGGYNDRDWTYRITGSWAGTLRVQRSFDGPDSGFKDFRYAEGETSTIIPNTTTTRANFDRDNNSIIYYRIGFKPSEYTSGTAIVDVTYDGGGGYGVCRVTGYNSPTSVSIEVIERFKNNDYTESWTEGEWSDRRGWPSAVEFFDGRLWWAGKDRFWGSVSDAYDSYNVETVGDSGPILRSVATGAVNDVAWLLPLQRLIIGTEGAEVSARSSSFDEPLTPTNITLKDASTYGSRQVNPAKIDSQGLFIDRSGKRLCELAYSPEANDYATYDLTKINREILSAGVVDLAVQRKPDTRVWLVLGDGRCVAFTYDRDDEVFAFTPVETRAADVYEAVSVLPGTDQDNVYFVVRRTIDGETKRYYEKMALDTEVAGAVLSKNLDCFKVVTNAPAATSVSGLDHLEGETVRVWADGVYAGEYTVASGSIALAQAAENIVVGLPYRWRYKSAKLAYGSQFGTAINQPKKVDHIGLLLVNTHPNAINFGKEFDNPLHPLDPMPRRERGADIDENAIWETYDETVFPFSGTWDTDSRICMEGFSPYPVTISGIVFLIATQDKT